MAAVDLRAYGVTDAIMQRAREASGLEDPVVGRVLSQAHELYRVVGEQGELFAEATGKLRHAARSAADFPAVGDFVLLDRADDAGGRAIVSQVLPRTSAFVRKAAGASFEQQVVAANIDTAFLCMSLVGDFNLRRLERYLALAWEGGAVPVVVLTKADACDSLGRQLRAVQSVAFGVDVLAVLSMEEGGCEAVRPFLQPGRTVALLGSSGVGKSTLVNRLLGEDVLETRDVRADGRGRHATTRRQLVLLPGGGLVMDTPGMRELGLGDVAEGLEQGFADVERLFASCRFSNCTHTSEPGCAVYEAIADGELSERRWQAYRKLKAEAAFAEDKAGYLAQKERRYKDISKAVRRLPAKR